MCRQKGTPSKQFNQPGWRGFERVQKNGLWRFGDHHVFPNQFGHEAGLTNVHFKIAVFQAGSFCLNGGGGAPEGGGGGTLCKAKGIDRIGGGT